MMKYFKTISSLNILLLGVLWSVSASAQSGDVSERLRRIENEIQTLKTVTPAPNVQPSTANAPYITSNHNDSSTEIRLQQLETQIRDLTGLVERQNFDLQKVLRRLDSMDQKTPSHTSGHFPMQNNMQAPPQPAPQNGQIFGQASKKIEGMKTTSNSLQTTSTTLESGAATRQYEQAFNKLKSGDYVGAEQGFSAFLNDYPGHALTPNVIYWLGETHYVRGEYAAAAKIFAEGYQKFPKSGKAPDNLLKLGMSLAGQGKTDDACIALGQLKQKYPTGPTAIMERAADEISRLGCR